MNASMPRTLIPLLAALALLSAACGGSDKKSTTGAAAPAGGSGGVLAGVKAVAGPSKVDATIKLAIDGVPTAAGPIGALLTQPIAIKIAGVTDPTTKASDVDVSIGLGALSFAGKLLSDGSKSWLQYGSDWYELDSSALTGASAATTTAPTASPIDVAKLQAAFGDPSQYLKGYETVGDEKVGDIDCTHVTGEVDLPKLFAKIQEVGGAAASSVTGAAGTSGAALDSVAKAIKGAKVDLWIGKDDSVLHRIVFALDANLEGVKDAQGVKAIKVDLDMTILPTETPTIEAPANAKPASALGQAIFGALGPALGAGALPTATG